MKSMMAGHSHAVYTSVESGGWVGPASAEATLMQVTAEPLISAASSLFTAKCFLYQPT